MHDDRMIRIREAQKHVDPVDPDSDPDPQHCILRKFNFITLNFSPSVLTPVLLLSNPPFLLRIQGSNPGLYQFNVCIDQ
jgi:hypothetical protein